MQASLPLNERRSWREVAFPNGEWVLAVGLALEIAAFAAIAPSFFTVENFFEVVRLSVELGLLALALTPVILTGGIDLSVGSLLALSGIVLSKLFNGVGLPIYVSILFTVIVAGLIGASVNGVLIGRVGLSFFVVTLGTLSAYGGLVSIWSKTQTTYISSHILDGIGFGKGLGVPTPIWIMIGTYLVAFVVLRWTYFGRDIYAVGGNIEAARLSGVNVSRTIICVYGIAGIAAGIAGVIQAGRLGAASPLVGGDIPLNAAAGVLLGGTSFVGGIGGVTGTAVGVLFIGVLQNGLSISGIQSFWQQVVTGAILIAAVAFDRLQQNRGGLRRRAPTGHGPTAGPDPALDES
jgi:ribose transport system permease protein